MCQVLVVKVVSILFPSSSHTSRDPGCLIGMLWFGHLLGFFLWMSRIHCKQRGKSYHIYLVSMGVVFLMVVTADDLLYIDFRMLLVGRLEKYKKMHCPKWCFLFMVMNAMGSNLKKKERKTHKDK